MMITILIALTLGTAPQAATNTRAAKPGGGPVVRLTATGTFSDGTTRLFEVTGDVDGDGKPETMTLGVTCSGSTVSSSRIAEGGITAVDDWEAPVARVSSPRDAASGLATGKRTHKPLMVRKDLSGRIVAHWDLATMKGARSASTSPMTVALTDVDPAVCSLH